MQQHLEVCRHTFWPTSFSSIQEAVKKINLQQLILSKYWVAVWWDVWAQPLLMCHCLDEALVNTAIIADKHLCVLPLSVCIPLAYQTMQKTQTMQLFQIVTVQKLKGMKHVCVAPSYSLLILSQIKVWVLSEYWLMGWCWCDTIITPLAEVRNIR